MIDALSDDPHPVFLIHQPNGGIPVQQQIQIGHRMVKAALQHPIQDDRVITARLGFKQRAFHVSLIFAAREHMTFSRQSDPCLFRARRIKVTDGKDHRDALTHAAQRAGIDASIICALQQRHLPAQRRNKDDHRHMSESTALMISFLKT